MSKIRDIFNPTMIDLAKSFAVSRQAVYDWQAGKPISAENAERLADFARAADLFALEGLTASAQILRRTIANGQNLFEIVRNGGSAESAVRKLIEIVRREVHQREALQARLARRPHPSREVYKDVGIPMLKEEG
jgi:predicted NBD/HSP70 family sugar kinase